MMGNRLYFEIYKEDHKPVLSDLAKGMKKRPATTSALKIRANNINQQNIFNRHTSPGGDE